MFEEIFTSFYEKNKEIKAIGVWGKDGLVLEKKLFTQSEVMDLEFTGAELADVIARIEKTKMSPQKFLLKLNTGGHLLLIYSLTPDFFLLVLAENTLVTGKLSFYLELYKNKLIASL